MQTFFKSMIFTNLSNVLSCVVLRACACVYAYPRPKCVSVAMWPALKSKATSTPFYFSLSQICFHFQFPERKRPFVVVTESLK